MRYIYKIHRLPNEDPVLLSYLAGRYTTVRLAALIAAPAAFGTTFARESVWTPTQWLEYLSRPRMTSFAAVAYSPETNSKEQLIGTGQWVGIGTLIGPTSKNEYEIPESGGSEIGTDEDESKWHITFVFASPDHRGHGIAKMLIQAALDYAIEVSEMNGQKQARVRIAVHPKNAIFKKLCEGVLEMGFVDAGRCTYSEAVKANGDAHLLPADGGVNEPEKYHTRFGVLMEKVTY